MKGVEFSGLRFYKPSDIMKENIVKENGYSYYADGENLFVREFYLKQYFRAQQKHHQHNRCTVPEFNKPEISSFQSLPKLIVIARP